MRERAEQWARRGAPVGFLDRTETDRHLGGGEYLASWIDRRGGGIQPLSFARGLAKAAQAAGAAIHGQTAATGLYREQGRWVVETRSGARVTADRVVICTNAYTGDLWPRLRETVVAPNSYQVATEPLSDNLQQIDPAVRAGLLGRAQASALLPPRPPGPPAARRTRAVPRAHRCRPIGATWRACWRVCSRRCRASPIRYRWCGRVAVTRDFLPHLHEPAPGLIIDIGCMGRGVGLQTAVGKAFADYIATGDETALPFPRAPIKPIPFHGLQADLFRGGGCLVPFS